MYVCMYTCHICASSGWSQKVLEFLEVELQMLWVTWLGHLKELQVLLTTGHLSDLQNMDLFIHLFVCVHVSVSTATCVWRLEDSCGCWSSPSTRRESPSCLLLPCIFQAIYLWAFREFSCPCLTSCAIYTHHQLYTGSRESEPKL